MFIAEGPVLVEEIAGSAMKIEEIFSREDWYKQHYKDKLYRGIPISMMDEKAHKKISHLVTPNQVLAVVNMPDDDLSADDIKDKLVLMLDDIKDPGNLGTIIRTADWYGIEHIICSSTSVDVFNPKVVQATMGSVARVKVHYTKLEDFLETLSTAYPVYAMSLDGEDITKISPGGNGIIIIGNEARGISPSLLALASKKLHIPSYTEGSRKPGAESLNASIATAIACHEFRRRK